MTDDCNLPLAGCSGFMTPIQQRVETLLYCQKMRRLFSSLLFSIWTSTFGNSDKYIWQFGQIYLAIWGDIWQQSNLKE